MPKFNKNKNQSGHGSFLPKKGFHDRYCCHCGFLIINQVLRKTKKCEKCRKLLPVREGPSNEMIVRCTDCDSFVIRNTRYCQNCKTETEVGIQLNIVEQEVKRNQALQKSNLQKALANNPKLLDQLEIQIPVALKDKPITSPLTTIDLTKSPFPSTNPS